MFVGDLNVIVGSNGASGGPGAVQTVEMLDHGLA